MSRLFSKPRLVRLEPGAAIEELDPRLGEIAVVLSNHFVRYAILPWSKEVRGPEEEQAYARHHFVRIFGTAAAAWELRSSPAPRDEPRLACAVDAPLMQALRAAPLRVVSVQPSLMHAYNKVRQEIGVDGAWFLQVEPGRTCVALFAAGAWRAVRNLKAGANEPGEWLLLLQQERERIGGELPGQVYVQSTLPMQAPPQASGWEFRMQAAA